MHWKAGHRDVCMAPSAAPSKEEAVPSQPCGLCYMTVAKRDEAEMKCRHTLHKACWERYQRENPSEKCPFCAAEEGPAGIFVQAMGKLQRNKREEVEEMFRKHLAKEPEDTVALFALSRLLMLESAKQGKVSDEVMKILQRMVELRPNDAGALLVIAQMYLTKGDFNNASLSLRSAEKSSPDDVDILVNLGKSLFCQGKSIEALDKLERARELEPTHAMAIRYYYTLLRFNGRDKEARKLLTEVGAADDEKFNDDLMSMVAALHNKLPRASLFKKLARFLLGELNQGVLLRIMMSSSATAEYEIAGSDSGAE